VHWYLIQTKCGQEPVAEFNLRRQGYDVYNPRLMQSMRFRGRWTSRVGSLFPRYLFVRLAVGQQAMGPIRSTIGVANIVRFGCAYAVVPDVIVDELRSRADPETGLLGLRPRTFQPGASVRITTGLFQGLEGVFQREVADERVVLLLELLGRETSLLLPASHIVPRETVAQV
jgi:transcriptional antiterminator RfaH